MTKKKRPGKITLNKSSIRKLSEAEASKVQGGNDGLPEPTGRQCLTISHKDDEQ